MESRRPLKLYYQHDDCFVVVFTEENAAQDFLARLRDILKGCGFVTIEDALDAGEFDQRDMYDKFYGWGDLNNATIYPYDGVSLPGGGYKVTLPGIKHIEDWEKKQSTKTHRSCGDEKPADMVNHPSHYQSETGLEVFDVIEAFTFDLKGIEAVDTGNVIKYICRWKKKNGLEDLEKARWYLNRLIDHVQKLEEENKK